MMVISSSPLSFFKVNDVSPFKTFPYVSQTLNNPFSTLLSFLVMVSALPSPFLNIL